VVLFDLFFDSHGLLIDDWGFAHLFFHGGIDLSFVVNERLDLVAADLEEVGSYLQVVVILLCRDWIGFRVYVLVMHF
jgi:hypothetical protein